ncbi:EF-hand domain-containing protein [Luteimonas sp. BDR2-5]|uniref:EF-hand domain-containing protein n=1 Tax=Proluteimonas luteida TaxID=2878685 RepID=UPI001E4D64C0|nr:EF-hand domain-containing protein [Luteimonas sp. BDR2-5]MCD9027136.1 EF-hand domain-containing protein [Luteimonas sp. BDR2-5]
MKNARKPLVAMMALGFAMATPLAFAQDASVPQTDPTYSGEATTQAEPTAQDTYADDATAQAQPQAEQGQVTWADLDVDSDGKLSRDEAAGLPALAQVFDDVDADSDGFVTPEEYQAYVARANGAVDDDA